MTWEEAKDQIAKQHGYESWDSLRFCHSMSYGLWETYLNRATKLYAREVADKAWEAAADHSYCAHFGPIPNKYASKEEFMRQLFPEKDSKVG